MKTSDARGENCQCKNIIEEILGKTTMQPWLQQSNKVNLGSGWFYTSESPGCTWHPKLMLADDGTMQPADDGGQFQLLRKYEFVEKEVKMVNPTCDYEVTPSTYRRRVCACK